MTEATPPVFLQGGSHPADDVRRFIATLVNDKEGVFGFGDLLVSEKSGTPNMSVDVAGGRIFIKGDVVTFQGTYHAENEGVTNLTIAAADASNPRWDLIVAEVEDIDHGGASDVWRLAVLTGTPDASPSDPTPNPNSYTLARVVVPALHTPIEDADITDLRTRVFRVPVCKVSRSGSQSIPNVTNTDVTFDTEDYDVFGWHTGSSGDVIPTEGSGWYRAYVHVEWASMTATSRVLVNLRAAGAIVVSQDRYAGPGSANLFVSMLFQLDGSTDVVDVEVFHDDGGAVNLITAELTVEYVGQD